MSSSLEPQPKQAHFLKCTADQILYGGARGGGKTYALIMKIQQHAELYGKSASILVLRRTYPELEDFIKKSRLWLTAANGWIYKKGVKTFEHTNGAECKLRFLEDADSFQGHEYTLICVEEAGSFESSEEIDKLTATQRSGDGVPCQTVMTANPGGPGNDWLCARFVDPAKDGFEMLPIEKTSMVRYYIPSTLRDNPKLANANPDYEDKIRISGPPHLVKAWLEGDWYAAPLGSVFKFEYFSKTWTHIPNFLYVVQSWDTAFKKTAKSDRSACTTWGVTRSHIYLLHAWAGKVEFPELKQMAKNLYGMWKPHCVYIEDRASGQSLIQELKRDTLIPVKPVQVDIDKVARAWAVTPMFETGRILVPHAENDWLHEYVAELCGFPKMKHDDYVDATSIGISRLMHFVNQAEFFQSNVVPFQPGYYAV